jgi:alpha-beta hydrolase superfamily lysophospholipase
MRSRGIERALACILALGISAPVAAAGRPVQLAGTDGTPLVGMFYEASSRPSAAVVLVHMLGRSKDDWADVAETLQSSGISALAIDLRGHGRSGGSSAELPAMVGDVRAALGWLAAQPGSSEAPIAVVGASLGANLAALAAADSPAVRAVALVSPSLDYRGVRLDAGVMKKIGGRPVWFAASTEDPYAIRTVKELTAEGSPHEQQLSAMRGHGTTLVRADEQIRRALVDWLRRTLIF